MTSISTYLNFNGNTEEAFNFYRDVFGSEFAGLMRFADVPPHDGMSPVPEEIKNKVMHIAMPIAGDHMLMGTDAVTEMGSGPITFGNSTSIVISPDDRAEADRLHSALSEGGKDVQPMEEVFFGYFGSFADRFGIRWMIAINEPQS